MFAEWLCVDAQDIIRATSHKSFIFQFKVIGIYQLGELAVLEKVRIGQRVYKRYEAYIVDSFVHGPAQFAVLFISVISFTGQDH